MKFSDHLPIPNCCQFIFAPNGRGRKLKALKLNWKALKLNWKSPESSGRKSLKLKPKALGIDKPEGPSPYSGGLPQAASALISPMSFYVARCEETPLSARCKNCATEGIKIWHRNSSLLENPAKGWGVWFLTSKRCPRGWMGAAAPVGTAPVCPKLKISRK